MQPLKNAVSDMGSLWYDRNKLALRPIGGSFVIFTPESSHGNISNVAVPMEPTLVSA